VRSKKDYKIGMGVLPTYFLMGSAFRRLSMIPKKFFVSFWLTKSTAPQAKFCVTKIVNLRYLDGLAGSEELDEENKDAVSCSRLSIQCVYSIPLPTLTQATGSLLSDFFKFIDSF